MEPCREVFQTLSRHKELKIVEKLCHKKRQLCRDTTSESAFKDKTTLSRQRIFMSRQKQHEVEVNSVTTKKSIVTTKAKKN